MEDKRLYLVDATALCYRAFYALKVLSASSGQQTNAVFGFVNILKKILKEENPNYLAICFDVSRQTFRQKKFTDYKIQRPPMPEGLSGQIPVIKEIIRAYGFEIFEEEGYEADDIIASLVFAARKKAIPVTVISQDKDMLQLVGEDVCVLSPHDGKMGIYGVKEVKERFGIEPSQIPDVLALMGDKADNIPGVSGVGEKTAIKLIQKFHSVENLFIKINEVTPIKLREALVENLEQIKLNKELVALEPIAQVKLDPERLKVKEPNYNELFAIFKRLEFKKFLNDLPLDTELDKIQGKNIEEVKEESLAGFIDEGQPIFIFGQNLDELVIGQKGRFFHVYDKGAYLKKILISHKIKKIGHDLKKIKVSLLRNEDVELEGLYFDTMLAAHLLNPSHSEYNITGLAWDYLGMALKPEQLDMNKKAALIEELYHKLLDELCNKKLDKLFFEVEMPLASVLARMESNGISIDESMLKKLSLEVGKKLEELTREIYHLAQAEFNLNSPKQLGEVLFEKLKLPVIKRTKTGPSTDEEVLRALAKKHKIPELLLEYRQLTKLKSTYIDPFPEWVDKKNAKVHSSFNQAATETGRLSSSEPNLQNIPVKTELGRMIRQAVIAGSEDSLLISCDYSQIELRLLAHMCHDENLLEAFEHDKDIHRFTASLIYGVEETEVTDKMRDTAKRVNFGIVYGLTSYGLSKDLGITIEEAQGFIDAYFTRYPRVRVYIDQQIKKAEDEGFVSTILGRRRYLPDIHDRNMGIRQFAQRKASNTPLQGSASDLIKLAMIEIDKEIIDKKLRAQMIIQVHDELIFDVPKDEFNSFATLVKHKMETVLKLDIPLKVTMQEGKNWSQMHELNSKKGEAA